MSNIKVYSGYGGVPVEFTTFSDGSENCKINSCMFNKEVYTIHVQVHNCHRDVFRILLVNDALVRLGAESVDLHIDYMPDARADRVFEEGNPHPLKVTANLINSCNFKQVIVSDPHSDVVEGVLNNVKIYKQDEEFLHNKLSVEKLIPEGYTLCSPDIGAAKKTFDLAKRIQHPTFIQGLKIRDVTTGNIVKCGIVEEYVSGSVLIVDDISDGGASFLYLAKLLKEKGAEKVFLYVTHGIFSKGLEPLKGYVDGIICNNIVCSYITHEDIENFNKGE